MPHTTGARRGVPTAQTGTGAQSREPGVSESGPGRFHRATDRVDFAVESEVNLEKHEVRAGNGVQLRTSLQPCVSDRGDRVHRHPDQSKQMPKERRRSSGSAGSGGALREKRAARRSSDISNGVTPNAGEAATVAENEEARCGKGCVPQVTITSDAGDPPQEIQEEDWNDVDGPLRRRLSNSSVSSTGSSTVLDESEDDILSDNETKSKGIVTLESVEDSTTQNRSWSKIKNIVLSPFVVLQRKRLSWIQLAGHKGSFKAGEEGTILKKFSDNEKMCFEQLTGDRLNTFVPKYHGVTERDGEAFLQLTDLLYNFDGPSVMDCKMGVRTYLEEELVRARERPKPRKDMYNKMLEVDSDAPTAEEHQQQAVTKPRYMQWRETLSSTHTLGFRIEGVKRPDGTCSTDFKKTQLKEDVMKVFNDFVAGNRNIIRSYLSKLEEIRSVLEVSEFFRQHEVIGSSLLFIHDHTEQVGVWLIDFGKTTTLPEGKTLNHRIPWQEGNREDGYLWGLDNLLQLLTLLLEL